MNWRRLILRDPATTELIAGQLADYTTKKDVLQAGIDIVSAYPSGRLVEVLGGTMTQEAWQALKRTT